MSNTLQPRQNAPIEIIGEFPSAEAAERCVDSLNDTNVVVQDVTVWNADSASAKIDLIVPSVPPKKHEDRSFIIMCLALSFSVLGLITTLALMAGEPAYGFFKQAGAGLTAMIGTVFGCMFGTLVGGVIAGSMRDEATLVLSEADSATINRDEFATETSIYRQGSAAVITPTPLSIVGKGKVLIDVFLDEEIYLKKISELMLKSGASKVTMRLAGAH